MKSRNHFQFILGVSHLKRWDNGRRRGIHLDVIYANFSLCDKRSTAKSWFAENAFEVDLAMRGVESRPEDERNLRLWVICAEFVSGRVYTAEASSDELAKLISEVSCVADSWIRRTLCQSYLLYIGTHTAEAYLLISFKPSESKVCIVVSYLQGYWEFDNKAI